MSAPSSRARSHPATSALVVESSAGTDKGSTSFTITPALAEGDSLVFFDGDITSELVVGETAPEGGTAMNVIMWPADFAELTEDFITVVEETEEETVVNFGTIAVADIVYNEEKYTQEELETMTKAEILDLADMLCLEMTTTDANTKAEIIADFLTQQG